MQTVSNHGVRERAGQQNDRCRRADVAADRTIDKGSKSSGRQGDRYKSVGMAADRTADAEEQAW